LNPSSPHSAYISEDLQAELDWFAEVLDTRFKLYFQLETEVEDLKAISPPDLSHSASPYAQLIRRHQWGFEERLTLALCMAPHLHPRLLDVFFTKNKTFDRNFTEFGGYTDPQYSGFLPTGETLLFLLAGASLPQRLRTSELLQPQHPLLRERWLLLNPVPAHLPATCGVLQLSPEAVSTLLHGQPYRPAFGMHFPAHHITTQLEWKDLVLAPATQKQIEEIQHWITHGHTLLHDWGMAPKLRPGYRSLFYGPPGTGKTLTATLLGKYTGRDVYKVDLSQVISKYIGETEKNLAQIFDQAEHKNWILFFDEADALFGKRSETRDAHDRYANQEVSYLLQRIEIFDGIVILASNMRNNLDDAFTRRFESMIYFAMPNTALRLRLWQQGFSPKARLAPDLQLHEIASRYELSGGGIMNVVRYASLQALANGGVVHKHFVLEGLRKEYAKEGRTV